MSHYINNQILSFISKNKKNKTGKKQNTLEIFEKITRKYYGQRHKSTLMFPLKRGKRLLHETFYLSAEFGFLPAKLST